MGYNGATMFKPHTVLGIGLWLMAISFLGITSSWKIKLYVLTGAVLVGVYLFHLGRETILKFAGQQRDRSDTFVENGSGEHKEPPSADVGRP